MTSKNRNKLGQPQRNIYVGTRKHARFLDYFPFGTSFNQACNVALDEYMNNHFEAHKNRKKREEEMSKLWGDEEGQI